MILPHAKSNDHEIRLMQLSSTVDKRKNCSCMHKCYCPKKCYYGSTFTAGSKCSHRDYDHKVNKDSFQTFCCSEYEHIKHPTGFFGTYYEPCKQHYQHYQHFYLKNYGEFLNNVPKFYKKTRSLRGLTEEQNDEKNKNRNYISEDGVEWN